MIGWRPEDFEVLGWVIFTIAMAVGIFIIMWVDERKKK